MDRTARYAAVNTKIRALEGKFLSDEDYLNLLSKKSVSGVAEYLKNNTIYKDMLAGVDENSMHRSKLENLLKETHINSMEKIVHYFYYNYREFYKTLFIRYEIEDLKTILRAIKAEDRNMDLRDSCIYIGRYSKINKDALLASGSLQDFIENLKGTVYYDYLHPLIKMDEDIELFHIMMVLDLAYFGIYYKNLKLISKSDREIIQDIQGVNVDLLNIQWIYRGLKFYNLSPEEIFNYTIAYGKEFLRTDIKDLCYSRDLNEFQNKVMNTKYSFLFDQENTKDAFMERRILRYQYFYLKKLRIKSGMDISSVILYSTLREYEVRDLITVIESIRYEMPFEEAKRFLIRKL
jgi:Archaeal/vacuolar-type H+-ATPase subunit C